MYVHPMEKLQAAPTVGALVGTITSAPILETFNQRWGVVDGVIFGQTGDPFKENYKHLTNVLNTVILPTQERVIALEAAACNPLLKPILCEDDLRNISDNMKIPVLMYEPVRKLFEEDRIYGFGFDKKNLPEEDVHGRLLANGTGEYSSDNVQEWITAEFHSIDPEVSQDELDSIMETRAFIEQWLGKQMGPDGEMIDPTDPDNVIKK